MYGDILPNKVDEAASNARGKRFGTSPGLFRVLSWKEGCFVPSLVLSSAVLWLAHVVRVTRRGPNLFTQGYRYSAIRRATALVERPDLLPKPFYRVL